MRGDVGNSTWVHLINITTVGGMSTSKSRTAYSRAVVHNAENRVKHHHLN